MRRPLLAGCLVLALAGVAVSQSETPPDQSLPSSPLPPSATEMPAMEAPSPGSTAKPEATTKPETAKDKPAKPPAKPNLAELNRQHLAQCLRDWDAATHMTRQEWARTCRRVVSNRVKFLMQQGQ
jgi:hypothetical protein